MKKLKTALRLSTVESLDTRELDLNKRLQDNFIRIFHSVCHFYQELDITCAFFPRGPRVSNELNSRILRSLLADEILLGAFSVRNTYINQMS